MNRLAHGTEEELAQTARERSGVALGTRSVWEQARHYLAGEILDAAARHGSLPLVQSEVLVPLELELMAQRIGDGGAPSQWVTRVLTALSNHHRTKDRHR